MREYLAMMAMATTLLMMGCDNDSSSAAANGSAGPAPVAATPPVTREQPNSAAELRALRLDPLPAKAFVLPAPPLKKKDLPKNPQIKKPTPANVPPAILEPLDLSVPSEVATPSALPSRPAISVKTEGPVADANLLPQLFRSEDEPKRFELGGRVISRDRSDDFEGAEVELRFRR